MRSLKLMLPFACVLLLCGCWDYNELNMQELVLGVGIDKTSDGIFVTIQTAGNGEEGKDIYTTSGKGFFDAVRNATSHVGKKLYWGHCRLVLFSEEAAREYTDEVIDVFERSQDVYLNISMAVARNNSAGDIISADLQGMSATENIFDTLSNEGNSRRFRDVQIWKAIRQRSMSDVYVLPTVELSDGVPRVGGSAVMKDGALAGFLNDEQMLLHSLMTESGAGGYLPVLKTESGTEISLEILKNNVKHDFTESGAEIKGRIVVSLGSVSSSEIKDAEIKSACEEYLNRNGKALIEYVQSEAFGDVFGMGKYADNISVQFNAIPNHAGMLREGEE